MLIDTHCHLDFPDFNEDRKEVINRALEAGINRMITIGTDLDSSCQAIELAEAHPEVFAAVGIHPCSADEALLEEVEALRPLCRHPRVVALGECGLDYHYLPRQEDFPDKQNHEKAVAAIKVHQKTIFSAQLALASEENLNVIIHQRNSWNDCLEVLTPFHGRLRAVFHCFSESTERARLLFQNHHLISLTGIVTFKKLEFLRKTVAEIPSSTYMVETDAPYLAPVPHRGNRCEPAHVRKTAEVLADCRGITVDELARETTRTAEAFFRFP